MPKFIDSLKKSGKLSDINITIAVVGSRILEEFEKDYFDQGWGVFESNLTIYGFDADPDACKIMNQKLQSSNIVHKEKHIPLALWNCVSTETLYLTKYPACSSLYPPNQSFLSRFVGGQSSMQVVSKEPIETTTLDNFCAAEGIDSIDFLQIDTQGADLKVLQGSENLLKNLLFLKVEVEFARLYENVPLFSDVDLYLRDKGFSLIDFGKLHRDTRRIAPLKSEEHPGQLTWTDAFYFQDLIQESELSKKTPEKLLKLACVADILDFYDIAMETLEYITWKYGDQPRYNFANNLAEVISKYPKAIEMGINFLPEMQRIKHYLDSKYVKESSSNKENDLDLNIALREINWIAFPDWSQPEETLGLGLQEAIKRLVSHPDRAKMTLLIDHTNMEAEDADLLLSSVTMNLLMEESVEVDEGPEIILVRDLSEVQWSVLMPKLQGRIKLEHENQEAISLSRVNTIPLIELGDLDVHEPTVD
ncbi:MULTISPECIES: FkbM family methyltransferase [unclassified Roseofilum]|uniref:FkbM family methyltransferase n=1 Tax=unclassified Roseofilum TaxID=2620099 RepID=UPI00298E654D|nr:MULTISPECIES: FkbM family methyltransferase [unclassified Roseofilum]